MLILSFSHFLKKLLLRSIPSKHKKAHNRQLHAALKKKVTSLPSKRNKETLPQALQPINKEQQNALLLIVHHDTKGHDLTAPEIVSGKIGEKINFRFKAFDNYNLIKIKGFTRSFTTHYALLTLVYLKKNAGSIWIISRDFDQRTLLCKPKVITGKIGDTFQVYSPSFQNYHLVSVKGQVKGEFSAFSSQTVLYYRKNTWLSVKNSRVLLKILRSPNCFDLPDGNLLKVVLPAGTVWRTFTVVRAPHNKIWYCLGGALWVAFDEQKMAFVNQDSYFLNFESAAKKRYSFKKTNTKAVIAFVPGKQAAIFEQPFGKTVTFLKDGKKVSVTKKTVFENLTWYYLNDYGWIQESYISLKEG